MEQILIYHPDDTFEAINDNSLVTGIIQAEHRRALLGEDIISIRVESANVRDFGIGDYIKVLGMSKYKINQIPSVTKISERKYQYDLSFEGLQYDLLRVMYRNTDVGNFNTSADFSLIGDIEMFLNVIINNLNRVFGAGKWELGSFPSGTETKNLQFNNENCLAALQRFCEEYKFQFVFEETLTKNKLHVRSVGTALDLSFKYGEGKGLYQLTRESVDSKNIINTLWAYGSTRNLPANYKNFAPRLILSADIDAPVLEATSREAFGIFEGSVTFDDIYPHRTGTVSGINESDRMSFSDSSMDFDLNASSEGSPLYLLVGIVAKIVFQTGGLSGYEFEITKYLHATKTFSIKQIKDPKGIDIPDVDEPAFQIAVGDTYVIVDIAMPQSYITAAENELEAKAIDYLEQFSFPTTKYTLQIDENYLKSVTESINVFEVGDTIEIKDAGLSIDSRIKISEFTRDLLRPYNYNISVQDSPTVNPFLRITVQNRYFKDIVKINRLDDPVKLRSDWRGGIQILSEIPRHLNETKYLPIGDKSEEVTIGNPAAATKIKGSFGIVSLGGYKADFLVSELTQDRVVYIPDGTEPLTLNAWDSLTGLPDSIGAAGESQSANLIFASPNGSAGVPDFRKVINADIDSAAGILTSKLADGAEFLKRSGAVAYTGIQDFGGYKAINLGTPTDPTDVARLVDVQNAAAGLITKEAVRVVTSANIALSGTQTIDGVSVVSGDRVLVKNQSAASQNGIYACSTGAWSRASDADSAGELRAGSFVFVTEGTNNADSGWVISSDGAITLGTSAINWIQFSGGGQLVAGAGFIKSGNQIDVITASTARIVVNADSIDLATTAVTPGIYQGLTVDAYGRITGAANQSFLTMANRITRETPAGTKNGVNAVFSLAYTPIAGSEEVYLNGILQEPGAGNDYTISGLNITMLVAPASSDKLIVSYFK